MTIAISISALMRQIYALSALRENQTHTSHSDRPRLLTRDNAAALRPILGDSIGIIACGIAPWLTDTNITGAEVPEIVTLTFGTGPVTPADIHLLQRGIEHAAVHDTLALVWDERDATVAAAHRGTSRDTIGRLRYQLQRLTRRSLRLTPHPI